MFNDASAKSHVIRILLKQLKLMELSCSTFSRLEVCNVAMARAGLQDNRFTQYIHLSNVLS